MNQYEISLFDAKKGKFIEFDNDRVIHSQVVAIGDLHASARKLVEVLLEINFIDFPNYEEFISIYDELIEGGLENISVGYSNFNQNIFQSITIKSDQKLVLLGDIVFDRGLSDYIILNLLKRLRNLLGERLIVLTSNHDWGYFYSDFYKFKEEAQTIETPMNLAKNPSFLDSSISNHEMNELYIDHLKSLSLFYFEKEAKAFFSHSLLSDDTGSGTVNWSGLGELLVSYFDKPINTIEDFVNRSNHLFTESVNTLLDDKIDLQLIELFDRLSWYANKENEGELKTVIDNYSDEVKYYVHGHYYYSSFPDRMLVQNKVISVNLNNTVRQGIDFEKTLKIKNLPKLAKEDPYKFIQPVFID